MDVLEAGIVMWIVGTAEAEWRRIRAVYDSTA